MSLRHSGYHLVYAVIYQCEDRPCQHKMTKKSLRSMTRKATVYIARHRFHCLNNMTPEQREALAHFEAATRQLQDALSPTPIVGVDRAPKKD